MVRMLPTWRAWASIALVGASIAAACTPGERHRRVPPDEFARLAALPIGSALDVEWIGIAGDRAYLAVWTATSLPAGSRVDVISCAVASLPPALVARLRADASATRGDVEFHVPDAVQDPSTTPPQTLPRR